jgi:2-C-methyl-D-erythritol 4-phosphate cytidylyltransferase/2-C-methyl-D-erythritol 2,4-cyclodiphosphate synthase
LASDIGVHFRHPTCNGRCVVGFPQAHQAIWLKAGGRIVNLDVTIVCEAEDRCMFRLEGDCRILDIATTRIADQATTSEQLGFYRAGGGIIGNGEAQA